jgi:hypothetical protein
MVERHHDYQLTVASVPAGGIFEVPLQLDTDAPFCLRLVRTRNIGLNGFRFQTPRKAYQSSELRTDWNLPTAPPDSVTQGPYPSRGIPIAPQMIYPIGSQIVCDIGNDTGETITNARILFRGSKLYTDGAISAPTYPAQIRVLPFTYPVVVSNVPASTVITGAIRDNQMRVRSDADFVFRYGVCDPFTLGTDGGIVGMSYVTGQTLPIVNNSFTELYMQLRDESRKAYSNEPIHINDLMGQGRPLPFGSLASSNPAGRNVQDDRVLWFPGLFTPEIYVPREHALYFDLYRFDGATYFPLNLHFRFQGMKVFSAS